MARFDESCSRLGEPGHQGRGGAVLDLPQSPEGVVDVVVILPVVDHVADLVVRHGDVGRAVAVGVPLEPLVGVVEEAGAGVKRGPACFQGRTGLRDTGIDRFWKRAGLCESRRGLFRSRIDRRGNRVDLFASRTGLFWKRTDLFRSRRGLCEERTGLCGSRRGLFQSRIGLFSNRIPRKPDLAGPREERKARAQGRCGAAEALIIGMARHLRMLMEEIRRPLYR